jgi:hypothetical protein
VSNLESMNQPMTRQRPPCRRSPRRPRTTFRTEDGSRGRHAQIRRSTRSAACASSSTCSSCARDEHRLVLRRRQVHAFLEHAPEVSDEPFGVRADRVGIRPDLGGPEEQREHRPDPVDDAGDARCRQDGSQTLLGQTAQSIETLVRSLAPKRFQRGQASRDADRSGQARSST